MISRFLGGAKFVSELQGVIMLVVGLLLKKSVIDVCFLITEIVLVVVSVPRGVILGLYVGSLIVSPGFCGTLAVATYESFLV